MTAAFAAMAAVSVAVTGAAPVTGIIFITAALLLSNIKIFRKCTVLGIPLLAVLCALRLPLDIYLLLAAGCIITAVIVKKNYFYSLPLLLAVAFVSAVTGMSGENAASAAEYGLIFLLPCAAGLQPREKIHALCLALAVSLPVMFGGGKIQTVCLLLPALLPVLLRSGKRIQSLREE